MKTKHLLMTLLLALLVPWAAQAQLTMTVCEGEVTNIAIPLNGYSTDTQGSCGEFIIPASQLSGMIGSEISQISFYPQVGYNWSTTFQVYVKEVEYTTLSGTIGPDACTVVYTGSLDASGTTMDIPFGDNYSYSGGNLLIGTYISVAGNYINNAYFYGIEAEGAAYASGTYSGSYNGSYNFIPKTTFTYFPADFCYEPANVHIVENTLGPREVAIEWDAEEGELFEESMQATSYFDPNNIHWSDASTSHYEEWDRLTPDTDYTFCVRKKCGTDSYSQPVFLEFRTTVACPAPVLSLVANSLTAFGATLSWTGFSDSYILQTGSIASSQSVTLLSESFNGSSMPSGWSGTTSNWGMSNTSNAGGEAYEVKLNWSPQIQNSTSRLITPACDLTGITSVTFSFKHMLDFYDGSYTRILGIATSSDGGATWNTGWSRSNFSGDVPAETISETITTSDMGKANVLFCIYFEGDSYGFDYWYFDDIEITGTSASYNWTTVSNNATSPYPFNNLTPETTYRVRVIGVCGGSQGEPSEPLTFTTTAACPAPTDLQANNITINSAKLSWDGSSDSYEVQLMPWYPAGEDVLPTGTLQTYSFPLEGTGTGNVVIRHYDVSNMFRLNIDDIVITNANDEVVYSQNFESCGGTMPSEFTLIDRDGDGLNWYVVNGTKVNGNYGLTSASWNGDILYPDNWLVLSNVQLGGKISFVACGQDASFAAEKFCVYVQKESDFIEEITDNTVLPVSNLVPRTPYDWTVKGFCGTEYETTPVPSYFETKDDVIVFATDGNWNEDNWVDWNGDPAAVPTANDKVRIDADAIIPANYVAYAKSIKIGVDTDGVTPLGSITIKDGGQLKQNGVADVIVEKEITGYGTGEGNWYFIATPLTTTHFNSVVTDWSYVNALDGTYDLYTFDPTAEKEWINYRFAGNDAFVSGSNTGVFATQVGYLYANEEDLTLQFEGSTAQKSLNNVVTEDFTYDANATYNLNGWSLVGNPFTCNAYITYLVGGQPIEANFYALNAEGNGYVECDSDDPLAPCTGAFIYYDQDVTIQYSTEQPIAKSTGMLNMTLSQGRGSIDQARVRFGQGYNMKHMSFRENSSISMPVEGNDYAVVYAEGNGEMPVNFKAERNGTYTLGFNTENVEFSYLHLIDNLTGNDVDLLATPSYSFEAQTTDYASRFKLVFATGSNDDNFAFFNNGNLIVNNEGEATLQVMDVNGRIIRSESINGTASIKMNAAAGVYMLRLINGNDVKVQKMIVK